MVNLWKVELMKKNNAQLLHFLLCLVVIGLVTVFAGRHLTANLLYDNEYGVPTDIVFDVASENEEVIKKTASVLEKRFTNFGADYVASTIEGNRVTIKTIGLEDVESLSKWITATGELSFRNYEDKMVMDRTVLDEEMPLAIYNDSKQVYLVFNITDSKTFYNVTYDILTQDTNKYLVLWADYNSNQHFAEESTKESPAYLAGAMVTTPIEESCYIGTHLSLEDAKNYVYTLNGGELPAAVTWLDVKAYTEGNNSASGVITASLIGCALIGAIATFLYGLPGLLTALSSIAYTYAYFRASALISLTFNSNMLYVYAVSLSIGLALALYLLSIFKNELLKGRNINTAYQEANKQQLVPLWEAPILQILVGVIGLVVFRKSFLHIATAITAGGVCNLVFFTILNRRMISTFINSNYFTSKSLYAVKEENLPDVDSGESHDKRQLFDFAVCLKGNLLYLIIAILAAAGLIIAITKNSVTKPALLHVCVLAAIAMVLVWFRNYRHYKKQYPLAVVIETCTALFGASLVTLLLLGADYQTQGIALTAVGAVFALNAFVSSDLRSAYRSISREKLTQEKLIGKANDVLNTSLLPLAAALIIGSVLGGLRICAAVLLSGIIIYLIGVLIPAKLWIDNSPKYQKAPKKKAKKNTGIKERTVYGINEERR